MKLSYLETDIALQQKECLPKILRYFKYIYINSKLENKDRVIRANWPLESFSIACNPIILFPICSCRYWGDWEERKRQNENWEYWNIWAENIETVGLEMAGGEAINRINHHSYPCTHVFQNSLFFWHRPGWGPSVGAGIASAWRRRGWAGGLWACWSRGWCDLAASCSHLELGLNVFVKYLLFTVHDVNKEACPLIRNILTSFDPYLLWTCSPCHN